jgi:hypothetical protein
VKGYEINCIVKDNYGNITQLGFKGKGVHSIFIITRLILSGRFYIYVYNNGNKVKVVVNESSIDNNESITSYDDDSIDINELNFLPVCLSKD